MKNLGFYMDHHIIYPGALKLRKSAANYLQLKDLCEGYGIFFRLIQSVQSLKLLILDYGNVMAITAI